MLWSFIIAAIVIELTPGPNMTWLAVLGASRGRVAALAAVAGIALGLTVAAIVAGIGLSALLYEFPILFEGLRWVGTLYLFYLAYDAWADADGNVSIGEGPVSRNFVQGLLSNALNPKAYLFYAAVLPRFVEPARDGPWQIAMLSAIYVGIATIIHAGIAIMAGKAATFLQQSPNALLLRKVLAALIAAAAIWFFISTKVIQAG
jgi:threonine/homoserine/homoserine lactone efflux protein